MNYCANGLCAGWLLFLLPSVGVLGEGIPVPSGLLPGGVNWAAQQPGVVGGIPKVTTIYTELWPTNSSRDISTAISSCPSNQVVYLNAGIYTNITQTIGWPDTKNGVVLRGAGMGKTVLVMAPGASTANGVIALFGSGWFGSPPAPRAFVSWLSGYSQGSTNITIASPTNGYSRTPIAVGNLILMTQANDTNVVNPQGSYGLRTVFTSATGSLMNQIQVVMVTGVSNGTNLTIWPGLYMTNIQASLQPVIMWQDYPGSSVTIQKDGVEDLTLDLRNGEGGLVGIQLINTYNCWVKNVEVTNSWYAAVHTICSAHDTIQECYIHDCGSGGASTTYGVNPSTSSDILVQNNIFYKITAPIIFDNGCCGCVFAYNYMTNMQYGVSPGCMMACIVPHGSHSCMNLIEGNIGTALEYDYGWGSSSHNMAFRNWLYGNYDGDYYQPPAKFYVNYTIAATVQATNRYVTFIGNVLGTTNYSTIYETSPVATPGLHSANQVIFDLGYFGNGTANADPVTATTCWRDGNYDYATHSTVWDTNGVQTLPASLYLTIKPTWWGTNGWPAIGPDVPGLVQPIPALLRFTHTQTADVPAPPTKLRVLGTGP